MELYAERGFEQTTVAEIAERAGLTERTFFRHYGDKREVLFFGGSLLQEAIVQALGASDPATAPIDAVAGAIAAVGDEFFGGSRDHSRQRQKIIDSHAELQERELIKMATLGAAIAVALRERGVADPAATLIAEAGIVIFRVAFERWIADDNASSFGDLIRESLAGLRTATAVA
jgi:AcrR family transcriptional regulator